MTSMAKPTINPKPSPFPRLLSARRVAAILSCSDRLVYQLVQDNRLEAYRIGKIGIRIPEGAVLKYLADNKVNPEEKYALENWSAEPNVAV